MTLLVSGYSKVHKREMTFSFVPREKASSDRLQSCATEFLYLSLGPSREDWVSKPFTASLDIYRNCIELIPTWLRSCGLPDLSRRQLEVLFGHLIFQIASRIARCRLQINKLGEFELGPSMQFDVHEFRQETHFVPTSSRQSFAEVRGALIGEYVEWALLELSARGVVNTPKLRLQPNKSVLGSPRRHLVFLERIYLSLTKVLAPLSRLNSMTISGTYLGRFREIALQLISSQIPLLHEIEPSFGKNLPIREIPESEISSDSELAAFLFSWLAPISLVEFFQETQTATKQMGYPSNPKVIFTSNSFYANDVFKTHLALNLPRAKYIVGQHGNGYGTHKTEEFCPEIAVCDSFISWGWGSNSAKIRPLGVLKPTYETKIWDEAPKGVLLILRPDLNCAYEEPYLFEINEHYRKQVCLLIKELADIGINTRVRFHQSTSSTLRLSVSEVVRQTAGISVDSKFKRIENEFRNGFLPVFTYDSTGMLEVGTSRGVFFSFLPEGLGLVKTEFRENYRCLERAKLLSLEAEDAAHKIAELLTNFKSEREKYLAGVSGFLEGIALKNPALLRDLRSLLKKSVLISEVPGEN